MTYVYNRVCSDEGQCVALQSNKKGQCLCWPLPLVVESCEDSFSSVVVWRQVHQRNQNPKESQDVHDQDDHFNGRQRTADKDVDEDTEHQYSPQQQSRMPVFSYVSVGVVQSRQLQDKVRDEEAC
jgi:hypothetical protein